MRHFISTLRTYHCAPNGLILGLLFLLLGARIAGADSTPAPTMEKINALIEDLHREYALPTISWGGAIEPQGLHVLQALRQSAERTASRAAAQELVKIGKPAVPLLTTALKTARDRKAQAIAQVLVGIGGRETLYPLLCLADDPTQIFGARLTAAIGAARQGDAGQLPLLLVGQWLCGEAVILADELFASKLPLNELDRVRLRWFRQSNEEMFQAAQSAICALVPYGRGVSMPATDVWGTILAWDKWWARGHPFRTIEVLVDDPWENRLWCRRSLGTLAEYGPMIVEMRRLFVEERLRTCAAHSAVSIGNLLAELRTMTYAAEPFPAETTQAVRFSLSGYVRSGMIIHNYGYDRSLGAWVLLDRMYINANSEGFSDR